MTDKSIATVMRSIPLVEKLDLPPRAELLPKIESGEIEHLDFSATVFRQGPNRNFYRFRDQDLELFARSFEGQPFLRDHDQNSIDSRDGTILGSRLEDGAIKQDIRLTTRRGMLAYLEGQIDRFSIGWWDFSDIVCSVCGLSFLSIQCVHWPGRKYITPSGETTCEITFIAPKGKETSAVNAPAVPGTGIDEALQMKLDVIGDMLTGMATVDKAQMQQLADGQAPASETPPQDEAQARRAARAQQLESAQNYQPTGAQMSTIRELMKKRAGLIEQAQALHTLAENETRDLTAEEREQFTALLDQADELQGSIQTLQDERERLRKAVDALGNLSGEVVKPDGQAALAMKRAEFDALDQNARAKFLRGGGKVEE